MGLWVGRGVALVGGMNLLKRYKYHWLAAALLLALLLAGAKTTKVAKPAHGAETLPRIQTQGQLDHALELFPLGKQVDLLTLAKDEDQRPFILNLVTKSLPASQKEKAYEITRAVITEANHHQMDPMFLLAVIATESGFNNKARGRHGEIGLMQLMPKTAKWLAPVAGLKAELINLEDPAMNIRLGATYFAQLRKTFANKGGHYVSAYNMGSLNVRRLLKANKEPKIYSTKVLRNYASLYAKIDKAQQVAARSVASVK